MGKRRKVAINFKLMGSDSGRLLRVMQAPGFWTRIYQDRIRLFGDSRGAIIFPEQLLGLDQAAIFRVSMIQSEWHMQTEIKTISEFRLEDRTSRKPLTTIEDIMAFEERTANVEDAPSMLRMSCSDGSYSSHGFTGAMFTSRKEALRWIVKQLLKET